MRTSTIALLFACLLAAAAAAWVLLGPASPAPADAPTVVRYQVTGMHCDGCAEAITLEVQELPGVDTVTCAFATQSAEIVFKEPATRDQVEHAITKLGYKIVPVPATPEGAVPPSAVPPDAVPPVAVPPVAAPADAASSR
ncbi:MAG: heavy-metal-associated domain-containing protein [Phycisphaerae bacterium]|nr:heavy-metal-associated domain-containing protein [Phycisphaerae bacterium]